MSTEPRSGCVVSVVIPVFNPGPLLAEQLAALAAQECDLPWEVVRGVTFGRGAPWLTLDLHDDERVAVMAVQMSAKDYAVKMARRLPGRTPLRWPEHGPRTWRRSSGPPASSATRPGA